MIEGGSDVSTQAHYQVRALERALDILDAFSLRQPELSLSDVALRADLAKSTALRLLAILEDRGYVERSPDTERYRIGVRAFEVGSIYIQSTSLESEAHPFLRRLATECNQTANLGILHRGEIVHIAVVPPERPIRFWATVGQREHAHCTGLGKALLACLSAAELDALIAQHGLSVRTPHSIVEGDALRRELDRVRARGYALDNEESEIGLKCVAAPIRDHRDRCVAAVSISGPAAEFSDHTLPAYVASVTRAAREISARLGNALHPRAADAAG